MNKMFMFKPIKVMDIELSRPLTTLERLDKYAFLQALVRLHGMPIGYVKVPVIEGRCTAKTLSEAILKQHSQAIIRHLLCDGLAASPRPGGLRIADLLNVPHPVYHGPLPLVTVAVCTRDRTADLARCLDSLSCLDYQTLDILVVDNAPSSDDTEYLMRTTYPNVRYVREPRPGLDWARNRAIIEARNEIIAYTDDDVVVDLGWVSALATVFAENPEVMAVTGLVVPYELETEAQIFFERYGGFTRGFERRWYRVNQEGGERAAARHGYAALGTGANMAYRRSLFERIGNFDQALDVGTVTNGGGDLEMFFRVLKKGYTLVYEPNAVVRHHHRHDYTQLRTQIVSWGTGLCSYFVRSILAYPDERFIFIRLGLRWFWRHILHLLITFVRPGLFPRDLIFAELHGSFIGLVSYQKARRTAAKIELAFGHITHGAIPKDFVSQKTPVNQQNAVAVCMVDLSGPLHSLTDVKDYAGMRVYVTWNGNLLGSADIPNHYQPVRGVRLREAIVDRLGLKLLEPGCNLSMGSLHACMFAALTQHFAPIEDGMTALPSRLPADISVSVVVATIDRPDDLRKCLSYLVAQVSPRHVEIVVVDNNPASNLTPLVVAEFPGVVLVNEPRKGLAYARNAGFIASKGDIVIATDDDVIMPPDWLEKLIAPFVRCDVMIVTGNVLPFELETGAQRLFELAGGLGCGFDRRMIDRDWFGQSKIAIPTWDLGATVNAAFRATIFSHPKIGLMDEALGPGMPSGAGEDAYLFYKVLKAGYTLAYEPTAYVWHKHRRDIKSLRRQIYNYNKGHVAYLLTTLLRDHDLRAIVRLGYELPREYLGYVKHRLRDRNAYPFSLIFLEIAGHLSGPISLWQSRRRVKREGRSGQYIPVSQRSAQRNESSLVGVNNV